MRFEADEITLVGGIRHGRTLGSPVAIEIANTEWPKWTEEMSPEPGAPSKVLTQPRPGHADLPGMLKYGFDDARDVLERASARETAARVAAGTLAKLLLTHLGVSIVSHIVRAGRGGHGPGQPAARDRRPRPGRRERRALLRPGGGGGDDRRGEGGGQGRRLAGRRRRGAGLRRARSAWAATCTGTASSTPTWPRRSCRSRPSRRSRSATAGTTRRGGAPTPTTPSTTTRRTGYVRPTDRAGGIEGGISNGALLVARVAMKPLATLNRPVLADGRRRDEGVDGQLPRAHRRHGRAGHGRRGRVDDGARPGHRGAAQVRRRLAGRGRAQPRRVRRLARDDAVVRRRPGRRARAGATPDPDGAAARG